MRGNPLSGVVVVDSARIEPLLLSDSTAWVHPIAIRTNVQVRMDIAVDVCRLNGWTDQEGHLLVGQQSLRSVVRVSAG